MIPEANAKTALLSILGLLAIAGAFYLATRFAPPAALQMIVPDVMTFWDWVTP